MICRIKPCRLSFRVVHNITKTLYCGRIIHTIAEGCAMSLIADVIRPDVWRAKSAARRAFRAQFPQRRIAKVALRADEGDHLVVCVQYGDTIPPRSKFYDVDKTTDAIELIVEDTPYRLRAR